MYRQQSLITLDHFYEWKPFSKLEAILSFIDFSLLEQFFQKGTRCQVLLNFYKQNSERTFIQ